MLRVYLQVFSLQYIEIPSYQFGKDNPDGIKSAAFWFYDKYGFRPVEKGNVSLAANEFMRMKDKKGYRSSEKTLLQLAECNMALQLKKEKPKSMHKLTPEVTRMIAREFNSNRTLAEEAARRLFFNDHPTAHQQLFKSYYAYSEWTLLVNTFKPKQSFPLIKDLIESKEFNLYRYNTLVSQWLELI